MTLAFTTSWDDGHPLDLRVAELLARHGCRGTFYTPRRNAEGRAVLTSHELRALAQGFEIGGHTIDHVRLDRSNVAQIEACKTRLEQELGHEVSGFSYPWGHHDAAVRAEVQRAGFRYARTIADLELASADPFRVPVTLQLYPHRRAVYLASFVHGGHWLARAGSLACVMPTRDLEARIDLLLVRAIAHGGVFHLWGHSWELQEQRAWELLDRVLGRVAQAVPRRLTNAEAYAPAASANTPTS
jgi:peptidoglycan/xylan/chitin deacetylase (PgdA/CDA1 family)